MRHDLENDWYKLITMTKLCCFLYFMHKLTRCDIDVNLIAMFHAITLFSDILLSNSNLGDEFSIFIRYKVLSKIDIVLRIISPYLFWKLNITRFNL